MMHKRNKGRERPGFEQWIRLAALTAVTLAMQGCIVAVGNSSNPGEQEETQHDTETSLSVSVVADDTGSIRELAGYGNLGKEEFNSIVASANRLCTEVPNTTFELRRVAKVGESGRVSMTLLIECNAAEDGSEDDGE